MMKNIDWKKIVPHIVAVALFAIVAVFYCKPALFDNKTLQQDDTSQYKAMAQSSFKYKETHGHFPLWINSMFCGMPGYQIAMDGDNMFTIEPITKVTSLFLSKPASFFFMACLCFYFLACVLGCNPVVAIGTAFCYAYCTYNPVILVAGHETKLLTIAYIPALIASVILLFQKKYVIGTALTAYTTSVFILAGHLQVDYYALIIIIFMAVGFVVETINKKDIRHLFIAGILAIVAGLTGVGVNLVSLKTTSEYGKYSIRGGSALADTNDKNAKTSKDGLNKDYAMSYSLYKAEPLVMMFPHIYGASSGLEVKEEDSKAIQYLQEKTQEYAQNLGQLMPKEQAMGLAQQMSGQSQRLLGAYWGGIGGTAGPPYIGIIICFLALMGFVVLDNKYKWWIGACILFTIMLSWGKYFEGFNTWMLNNLPAYNKFRAPSMILIVPTFLLCMMAAMTLNKLVSLKSEEERNAMYKKVLTGFGVGAAFIVIAFLMLTGFDYRGESDNEMLKGIAQLNNPDIISLTKSYINGFLNAHKNDRYSLFLGDIIKGIFLCGIVALLVILKLKKNINSVIVAGAICAISFIDVMVINAKYLNEEKYIESDSYVDKNYEKSSTVAYLLNKPQNFRVFNVSVGLFNAFNGDAKTSYYLNSIGGYHPAKMSIYQDIMEKQLYNFPNCMPVINMLNTRYIIQGNLAQDTIENKNALGNCWFVKTVIYKETPKDVMNALTTLDTKDSAVVFTNERQLVKYDENADSAANISLIKNDNDFIEYQSSSNSQKFAVFSEVYYNAGWKAYIDGNESPIVRTNYVLRGLSVPAGKHKITFEFKPDAYYGSMKISNICSALIWLLLLGSIAFSIFKWKKKTAHA